MAQVVLVYPRTGMDIEGTFRYVPLSILTLAAPLVKLGYSVELIDQRLDKDWKEKLVRAVGPETIAGGISTMTGIQLLHSMDTAKEFRRIIPGLPLVWGGAHPTLMWEQCLSHPNVDIVNVGEGDETFPRLIQALEKKEPLESVAGIAFKDNGRARFTGMSRFVNLDALLPLPYHLIPLDKYLTSSDTSEKTINIETSRGCPARCTFCYYGSSGLARWRYMSAHKTLEMIREVMEMGIMGIWLYDSNFFASLRRATAVVDGLEKAGITAKFKAQARAEDLIRFDIGFLRRLRNLGFEKMFVGVESGSDRILKYINKKVTIGQVYDVDRKLREADITPFYSFMAGIPSETIEDIQASLTAMKRLVEMNPAAEVGHLSLCSPYPGTEIFQQCREQGWIPPETMEDWVSNTWNNNETPWLAPHVRRFAKKGSILSYFMNYNTLIAYYPRLKGPVRFMVNIYCRLVKWRIERRFYHLMPEIRLLIYLRSKMYSS